MGNVKLNPYQAPTAEPNEQTAPATPSKRWLLLCWVCSIAVLLYGLAGVILNGLDLAVTLSARDLKTEIRLLGLFAFGCFLCWLAYSIHKRSRGYLTALLVALSLSGVGYVICDLL